MVLFIRLGFILLVFILASGLSIEMSSSAKKLLRQLVKTRVADLSSSSATLQSEEILKQLRSLEEVQSCRMPSIFLSMAGEVDTMPIVDFLLQTKGVIALPKVTGPKPHEMIMLPAYGRDEIATFVKTKWGIPEPPLKDNYTFEQCREIDLVFVPGVGFDKTCARVGHGRGYYGNHIYTFCEAYILFKTTIVDSFIDRLTRLRLEAGLAPPICIGLALSEQIVEDIPMDENDRYGYQE